VKNLGEPSRIVRLWDWEEYRKLALKLKPESMLYTMQRTPLSKPPIGLRLIFTSGIRQYVFLDFAAGDKLRQTRIPIKFDKRGEAYLEDEDVRNFILEELGRKDLAIHSMEVLGY
jgi:hypothetical protein